jgi:Ca-activated chloride channel family protein
MIDTYGFYFNQPLWLLGLVLLAPVIWLGLRNLAALEPSRRILAIVFRCLIIIVLFALLARPVLTRTNRRVTLIAVIDKSQSIPTELQQASLDYLNKALDNKIPEDKLAVVDVAEAANISKLPSEDVALRQRNTSLNGQQSKLSDGIQMAMAIAPPDTAARILFVSEGNETSGDLKEAARIASVNGIPVDVLPLHYKYENEVIFRRLAAPTKARSEQTISLRFILNSTSYSTGRLQLNLNDKELDLDPDSPEITLPIELKPGTNVKTISLPVGTRGIHEFEAIYIPDEQYQDVISQNNSATAITNVEGPGHVLVVDTDGKTGRILENVLTKSNIDVRYSRATDFPDNLTGLMATDAVIFVNADCSKFTFQQQEILCRYVTDLGGGLVMVGGPEAFGAGGWIGSPVADILPVDLDPPQKKQMPKGALVLVIDRSGSMAGEKVEICKIAAIAASRLLSRRDLVGLVIFDATSTWLVPLEPAEDKDDISQRIRSIGAGGGTVMGPAMQMAFESLADVEVAVKHVILLTDGQTSDSDLCAKLGVDMADSDITVSTVAVGPETNSKLLYDIAQVTQGRFYRVNDPMTIPEIFVKEAQVVRRSMIIEQTFLPQLASGYSEILGNLSNQLPVLDGYVLTGPKGGLNQIVLASGQADPVLATCQSGMGRCVAFTSSIDSRWASNWLQWGGFGSFWEQLVRWSGKPSQSTDCDVTTDIQSNRVIVNVEAADSEGKYINFADIEGQIIAPDVSSETLDLTQIGPGQYQGRFEADTSGSYIVNLRYQKLDEDTETHFTTTAITIPVAPEFRDLTDNAPLLTQISEISGGRILSSDPNQANLFDRSGLKFPETQMPLIKPLMIIWLALFLLDIAVRRVILDFHAIYRRIASLLRYRKSKSKEDKTLEQLKLKRQKVRDQLSARSQGAFISRRYEADEKFEGDLPMAKSREEKVEAKKTAPQKKETVKDISEEQASHIQRLLKAKRKAEDGRQNKSTEYDT